MLRIEQSVDIVELQDVQLFVFTENMIFQSEFYKETLRIPFLFEIFLRLNQIHIQGELVVCVFCISEIIIIEAVIYGLPRVKNMLGMMRGVNHLRFFLVRYRSGGYINGLGTMDQVFVGKQIGQNETSYFFEKRYTDLSGNHLKQQQKLHYS